MNQPRIKHCKISQLSLLCISLYNCLDSIVIHLSVLFGGDKYLIIKQNIDWNSSCSTSWHCASRSPPSYLLTSSSQLLRLDTIIEELSLSETVFLYSGSCIGLSQVQVNNNTIFLSSLALLQESEHHIIFLDSKSIIYVFFF